MPQASHLALGSDLGGLSTGRAYQAGWPCTQKGAGFPRSRRLASDGPVAASAWRRSGDPGRHYPSGSWPGPWKCVVSASSGAVWGFFPALAGPLDSSLVLAALSSQVLLSALTGGCCRAVVDREGRPGIGVSHRSPRKLLHLKLIVFSYSTVVFPHQHVQGRSTLTFAFVRVHQLCGVKLGCRSILVCPTLRLMFHLV